MLLEDVAVAAVLLPLVEEDEWVGFEVQPIENVRDVVLKGSLACKSFAVASNEFVESWEEMGRKEAGRERILMNMFCL